MKIQKKQFRLAGIVLLVIFSALVFPAFTAFAQADQALGGSSSSGSSDSDTIIERSLEIAKKVGQYKDDGTVDQDAEKARNAVLSYLESHLDELGDDPTVQGGYEIIDKAVREAGLDVNVARAWKPYFKQEAMALGVSFESVHTTIYDPDTGAVVTYTNQEKRKSEIENAALKVNLLTWDNAVDSQGNSIADINRGVLAKLLERFDNGSFATQFTKPLCALAMAITIAFGCMNLVTLTTERNVGSDTLTREFIKVILGVWFIYNFRFFALWTINVGTMLLSKLQLSGGDFNAASAQYALVKSFTSLLQADNILNVSASMFTGIWNGIKDFGTQMSEGIGAVSGFLGNGIIQLASSLVVYAVAIEIGVRYALTPIAIADLYSERFRSAGWMWLKKLLACAMQGAVLYLIIFVTNELKSSIGATFSVITNTAINLTMIGMYAKSRQIANDIIGVH